MLKLEDFVFQSFSDEFVDCRVFVSDAEAYSLLECVLDDVFR